MNIINEIDKAIILSIKQLEKSAIEIIQFIKIEKNEEIIKAFTDMIEKIIKEFNEK